MNQHDTLAVTGSSKHQQTKIASEAHFNRIWIKHSRNRKTKFFISFSIKKLTETNRNNTKAHKKAQNTTEVFLGTH